MKTYDYLLSFNVKPSVQRLAIMDYLLTHRTHPSIDEIYMALCDDIPTLSKTTVYNTLKLFVEHGAAQMLTIDEKNACYDADTSLHAHFLCKKCNKIFDLPAPAEDAMVGRMKNDGYQVEELHYYYKGVCPKCMQQDDNLAN
jgi:Fe2+ or Zn2+ uptake regulation protein